MNEKRKAELWAAIHQTLIKERAENGEVIELFGKQVFWCIRFSNYSKIQSLTQERSKMKTEQEVRFIAESHRLHMGRLMRSPEQLKKTAEKLGWTEEFTKGYNKGVDFAYTEVLGDKCNERQNQKT